MEYDIEKINWQLVKVFDTIATKGFVQLDDIPEFVSAAGMLHISRIVRTMICGGKISEAMIYKDTGIFPLYNKTYERTIENYHYACEFYTDIDFSQADEQTEQLFGYITSMLSIICTCKLNLQLEKQSSRLDRDSGIPNSKGFRAFMEEVIENGILTDYALIRANIKGCNTLNTIFGYQATTEIIIKYA
ncbi:MAG: GGDEF domain-containing protein, partial [Huintestinicola sp.]